MEMNENVNVAADGTGENEFDGFRLGPGGAELMVADAWARQKIAQLEKQVAELAARPQVFVGTNEEIQALSSEGKIRIGDLAITTDDDSGENADENAAADGQDGQ